VGPKRKAGHLKWPLWENARKGKESKGARLLKTTQESGAWAEVGNEKNHSAEGGLKRLTKPPARYGRSGWWGYTGEHDGKKGKRKVWLKELGENGISGGMEKI